MVVGLSDTAGHQIDVVGRVPYPDGSLRILWRCVQPDCVEGHVEATPPAAAERVVALLAREHDGTGMLLDGLLQVGELVGEPC